MASEEGLGKLGMLAVLPNYCSAFAGYGWDPVCTDPEAGHFDLVASGLYSGGASPCNGAANGSWQLDWYTTLTPSGLRRSYEYRTASFAGGIGWRLVIIDRHAASPSVLEARNLGVGLIWRWEFSIGDCSIITVPGCSATGSEAFTLAWVP